MQIAFAGAPDAPASRAAFTENVDRVLGALSNIALREQITRFAGAGTTSGRTDAFEADVTIADGVEQYTNVRGHNRTYRHISQIGGVWAFGEVVTMLRATRDMIGESGTTWRQTPDCTVVRFRGSAREQRWFVLYQRKIYWLDFDGEVRISAQTGDIESLTWTADSGPAHSGVDSILWEVKFHSALVGGEPEIVPADSLYRVERGGRGRKAEWNTTHYIPLGRFGSTTTMSFGGE